MSQVKLFVLGEKFLQKRTPKLSPKGIIVNRVTDKYAVSVVPSGDHPYLNEIGFWNFIKGKVCVISRSMLKKIRNHKDFEIEYVTTDTTEDPE